MKLKKILEGIADYQVYGSQDTMLTGVSANSKSILPGYLFIAKRGKTYDGRQYLAEAIEAGASVIVTDHFNPSFPHTVQVVHPNVASIEAALAAGYYQHPSQDLLMVGITGTNGKTTTSFIIKHLLDEFCGTCGLIGTIEYIVGAHRYPATRTTPDVTTNHKMLREMLEQGCRSAVMEVTSHALDQGRVDNIDFDVAVFSNLTCDHLDYHETMESYCRAKNRLFRELGQGTSQKKKPRWAIVNQDSPWASQVLEGCQANILTYGIESPADLYASSIRLERTGTYAKVAYDGQIADCFWPLVGRFNVYNCLAAMAVALTQQFSLEKIVHQMAQLPAVRGRLQFVENPMGLKIYVDFAHSDDALMKVLGTLKELQTAGRLIVVFGCGGDRDRTKRPKMAKACERYADFCLVTSDNPRSEDPQKICEEIVQGFTKQDSYEVEVDRRKAIQKAIEKAHLDDIILIAGKGHEPYQIFAHETTAFDDCQVAAEICAHLEPFKTTSKRNTCFA
jgi:UDP-N-acetylmuramoyl-L-alanyl-D-glutamate--2,6-diaminopimelate ligase